MKAYKKTLISLTAATASLVLASSLVACGGNKGGEEKRSELIGSFESAQSSDVTLTNDKSLVGASDGSHIYTSSVYPLNTVESVGVRYASYQKLRLRRDYTYEYTLEIMVRMVSSQANVDLAKLEASVKGDFEYKQNSGENYTVTLSDPTSGDEKRYGSYIVGENNIYGWKMSSAPNYKFTVSGAQADGDPEYDRYIRGKTVGVEKRGTERVLYSDMFFSDIFDDIAPYCSYDASSAVKPNEPDKPSTDPDDPERPPTPEEPSVPSNPDAPTVPARPQKPPVKYQATSTELPFVDIDGVTIALGIDGGGITVKIKAPSNVDSVSFGSDSSTKYTTVGDARVFAFPIRYSEMGESFAVGVGTARADVSLVEYLGGFEANGVDGIEARTLAANILNVADVCGADVTLDDALIPLVYDASGNAHRGFFGESTRNNLTLYNGANNDQKKDGFKGFSGVPELITDGGNVALRLVFETERDFAALGAKATVGTGEVYATDVVPLGGNKYAVTVGIASPLGFDDDTSVTIYDGDTVISPTASYSVTRAVAYVDEKADASASDKALPDALWSLGKAASLYADRGSIVYAYSPMGDKGVYSCNIGEYAYRIEVAPKTFDGRWGAEMYIGGVLVHDNNLSDGGDGFTAERTGSGGSYAFDADLDGATLDGIHMQNSAGGTLNVNVKSDSTLTDVLLFYRWVNEWYTAEERATLYSDCDVVITGGEDATLTVCGNIFAAGSLTVDGVAVEIVVKDATGPDGLSCGALNVINGGSLTVRYDGLGLSQRSAINASGNVVIDGTLDISGFVNGVYLSSSDAEQTFTVDGGKMTVDVSGYGITSADAFIGAEEDGDRTRVNKELYFNGGVTSIFTGNGTVDSAGISGGNVTVGDAELNIIADSGYCIEAKNPVAFRTTSGDYKKGKVVLVNNFFNEWYDVNYALKVKTLDLDGGNVYAYALCRGGVIHTETGATLSFKNCDITVKNGQDVTDTANRGYGIDLGGGSETVTVERSARVFFESVAAALRCWGRTETDAPEVINNGVIVLDNYVVGLEPWIWSMTYTFINNGQVHGANQIAQ